MPTNLYYMYFVMTICSHLITATTTPNVGMCASNNPEVSERKHSFSPFKQFNTLQILGVQLLL